MIDPSPTERRWVCLNEATDMPGLPTCAEGAAHTSCRKANRAPAVSPTPAVDRLLSEEGKP